MIIGGIDTDGSKKAVKVDGGAVVVHNQYETAVTESKGRMAVFPFSDVNSGDKVRMTLSTSASNITAQLVVAVTGNSFISVYEGITANSAGTQVSITDVSRIAPTAVKETAYINTNVVSLGTVLVSSVFVPSLSEVLLPHQNWKAGTSYYFELESRAAAVMGSVSLSYFTI